MVHLLALAQRVRGWGRIKCVRRLRDTNDPEIQRWILTDRFRNDVMNEYLAHIAATTGDLAAASPNRELLTAAGDIIDALLMGGPAKDMDDYADVLLADRAARHLDLGLIASGPSTAIGLGPEFKTHAALGWSLQGVRDHPGVGTDLLEAALYSPSIQNRNGALNALEAWNPDHWTTLHQTRLRTMADTDPDDKIRARANQLLQRSPGRP